MSVYRSLASLTLSAAVLVLTTGCEPRATREQCEKMVENMTEIQVKGESKEVAAMTRELMKGQSDGLLEQCEGKASQSEVQCVIDAKSEADIQKCE